MGEREILTRKFHQSIFKNWFTFKLSDYYVERLGWDRIKGREVGSLKLIIAFATNAYKLIYLDREIIKESKSYNHAKIISPHSLKYVFTFKR